MAVSQCLQLSHDTEQEEKDRGDEPGDLYKDMERGDAHHFERVHNEGSLDGGIQGSVNAEGGAVIDLYQPGLVVAIHHDVIAQQLKAAGAISVGRPSASLQHSPVNAALHSMPACITISTCSRTLPVRVAALTGHLLQALALSAKACKLVHAATSCKPRLQHMQTWFRFL